MSLPCSCCLPSEPPAPATVENRPGLSAIAYRIGTYATFREALVEQIAQLPELAGFTTRDDDDYGIAILDLWSAVADVLTFYQERYANEAYLRTATQRESVVRLARLLDYTLRPGVAAVAELAFTVEDGKQFTVPVGFRVQSVPGQDETPQTYETIESVAASATLNRLRIYPAPFTRTQLSAGRTEATLDRSLGPALAATLNPGDAVLLFVDGATTAVEQKKVAGTRTGADRAFVSWTEPVRINWGSTAQAFKTKRIFRIFGHDAPKQYMTASAPPATPTRITWSFNQNSDANYAYNGGSSLYLDAVHRDLAVGSKLLLEDTRPSTGKKLLVTLDKVEQAQISELGVSGVVTLLSVSPSVANFTDRRQVVIRELAGPELAFWNFDYASSFDASEVYLPGLRRDDTLGPSIEVDRGIAGNALGAGLILRPADFAAGRSVIVTDGTAQITATVKAEPTITAADAQGFAHMIIGLNGSGLLANLGAVLLGNVATATHGETVSNETVGSGNGALKFARLGLKKRPLTYIPGTGPGGVDSTLTLLVDNAAWQEVPGLYALPPTARVYATRMDNDGNTVVLFGDGKTGAIPPTGRNNVTAKYRVGSGLAGRVGAGTLTTALQRPPGFKDVSNPLAADGGADPEVLENARTNAPRTVRTFGRAVSLRDFEDLVTESGEVAKSQAAWVWDSYDRAIVLTVAAQGGALFSDDALRRLAASLDAARDPNHRLRIANYRPVPVVVKATVQVDAASPNASVAAAAAQALSGALSFDALALGQAVGLSDVYRVLQGCAGVAFVLVTGLMFKKPASMTSSTFNVFLTDHGVSRLPDGTPDPLQPRLRMMRGQPGVVPGSILPAELAVVETPAQDLILEVKGGLQA